MEALGMITFFEKPGCLTNRKQKAVLVAAGFDLKVMNLLEHPWQADELEAFFSGMTVDQWFNPSAPAIKKGEVDPSQLGEQQALELMIAEPILIRRPLMEVNHQRMAGFDLTRIAASIDMSLEIDEATRSLATEQCSRPGDQARCS